MIIWPFIGLSQTELNTSMATVQIAINTIIESELRLFYNVDNGSKRQSIENTGLFPLAVIDLFALNRELVRRFAIEEQGDEVPLGSGYLGNCILLFDPSKNSDIGSRLAGSLLKVEQELTDASRRHFQRNYCRYMACQLGITRRFMRSAMRRYPWLWLSAIMQTTCRKAISGLAVPMQIAEPEP